LQQYHAVHILPDLGRGCAVKLICGIFILISAALFLVEIGGSLPWLSAVYFIVLSRTVEGGNYLNMPKYSPHLNIMF
jgi:hypothetical protein